MTSQDISPTIFSHFEVQKEKNVIVSLDWIVTLTWVKEIKILITKTSCVWPILCLLIAKLTKAAIIYRIPLSKVDQVIFNYFYSTKQKQNLKTNKQKTIQKSLKPFSRWEKPRQRDFQALSWQIICSCMKPRKWAFPQSIFLPPHTMSPKFLILKMVLDS